MTMRILLLLLLLLLLSLLSLVLLYFPLQLIMSIDDHTQTMGQPGTEVRCADRDYRY